MSFNNEEAVFYKKLKNLITACAIKKESIVRSVVVVPYQGCR